MKRFIFDFITSPFSLFDNPFYNYIAIAVIGYIAYKIAYATVGNLGLRGEIGSIVHWIIRLVIFTLFWLIACIAIKLTVFIINNWILVIICFGLLSTFYIIRKYAKLHPNSFLNKKIF